MESTARPGGRVRDERVHEYPDPGGIFASCGQSYRLFRRRHATAVVDFLLHQLPRAPRVLDLACGPGTLGLDLAERGAQIVGVDASQEMLDEGRTWAGQRGLSEAVKWCCAPADEVDRLDGIGSFDGVVIADAFHWLDRERVLAALDKIVRPGGFVAVVGYRAPGTQREWWHPLLVRLREKHLGAADLAGPATAYIAPGVGHEEVVRASPFASVRVLRADYQRAYTLDELVGLQRTFAYSSAATLGVKQDAFETDLRTALRIVQPHGTFTTTLQAAVIVGHRP
ncbi:class I SAM-dependent methyltransferase [Streptomyces sp. NPDC088768]|uniref:class I SAM-dependent methyltransferase n=1 Tax=Streptomyces sp. NPDC088768 TaxID=3365894 RepID=UPI003806C211